MKRTLAAVAALLISVAGLGAFQMVKVDPDILPYKKASGVSGSLSSIGSDSMNNLMTLWTEAFRKFYLSVKIQVEGKGSSTAPPALIAGTAQFGPMSRQMRSTEVDAFQQKYLYKPTEIRTSYDALSVWVHKDNPIKQLSLAQVEAVFGKTRRRNFPQDVTTWGQLGLTGDWAKRPLGLYGRNSASGTYGYFKEHVLMNGDFKNTVKEHPGSASVVQGITEDRYGIGYSGTGYRTSGVRAVPLSESDAGPFFEGTYQEVTSGKYPLSRYLYIYVNKAPRKAMDPLPLEFLRFVLSREGQEVVVKDGYMPLLPKQVEEELAKLK